jgi:phosphate transport system substrate-binding protein
MRGWLGTLLLLVTALVGCKSEKASHNLTITGASTLAPLVSELAKRFEERNPGVRVDVQMGGSSRGIADARQGVSDIGMVSRDLKPDEADLEGHAIGRDGISIILHQSNPVESLTSEQVASIYTGRVTTWKEVGGADTPIVVVNKAEGRSTLELFLHQFKLKNSDVKAQVIIGDNPQGIKTVEGNPAAIGYVSIGAAEVAIQQGSSIKLLPMNGIAASTQSLRSGAFPLARTLHLVTRKGVRNELAERFISFAQSRDVHDLVEKQYFVPLEK